MNLSDLSWYPEITKRLKELKKLKVGWDGYQGIPMLNEMPNKILNMLEQICNDNTPKPYILPGPLGTAQIEWHNNGIDLEIFFETPNTVYAYKGTSELDEEMDIIDGNYSKLAEWVKLLV